MYFLRFGLIFAFREHCILFGLKIGRHTTRSHSGQSNQESTGKGHLHWKDDPKRRVANVRGRIYAGFERIRLIDERFACEFSNYES